jgi:hypothetical protein
LPAREQLGVFEPVEQSDGLANRFRIVIAERRWLHLPKKILMALRFFTYTINCVSIQKKAISQIWDTSAVIVLACCDARRFCGEER